MNELDNDFLSNLRQYLNSDYELDNSNAKKYVDLIGKERAKLAVKN